MRVLCGTPMRRFLWRHLRENVSAIPAERVFVLVAGELVCHPAPAMVALHVSPFPSSLCQIVSHGGVTRLGANRVAHRFTTPASVLPGLLVCGPPDRRTFIAATRHDATVQYDGTPSGSMFSHSRWNASTTSFGTSSQSPQSVRRSPSCGGASRRAARAASAGVRDFPLRVPLLHSRKSSDTYAPFSAATAIHPASASNASVSRSPSPGSARPRNRFKISFHGY
jgi:hypothetical protein